MQPLRWQPPVALTIQEEQIVKRIRKAKLFVFLRHHRHELFDESFQEQLATLYQPSKRWQSLSVREDKRFSKQAFTLDWERQVIQRPAEQEMPFAPGGMVHFPKGVCVQCPLKAQCTTSSKGRSVSIHPDEALLTELRERQQTPQGRAKLRERVAVEHTLAHVGRWQGRRARYRGVRKNLFDLRRCAVVHNLHVLARSQLLSTELQDAA